MKQNIDILLDKRNNDMSIIFTDDSGVDGEVTLSVEQAWEVVVKLNTALRQLVPMSIDVRGNASAEANEAVVHRAMKSFASGGTVSDVINTPKPERIQAAVLESIGADQKRPRHVPPGFPAAIKKSGLRDWVEPVVEPVDAS